MNTIYDGTYVLGQTSATNFQAGPGIKIDSPSAGTVRIGSDETVLWDGNGTALSSATLDESIYNFESVRIDLFMGTTIQSNYVCVDNSPTYISTGGITTESGTYVTYVFACSINISNSGKTLTVPQKGNGFAVLTDKSISYFKNNKMGTVRRIVGINRISGSNA